MLCGGCACQSSWIAGGQRVWTYSCNSGVGGGAGTGGTSSGTGGASTSMGGRTNSGGATTSTGGTSATGGATSTGGRTAAGGAVACDASTIGTSPNTLSVAVDSAQTVVPKEIFGLLMEILGKDINGGIYVGKASSIPNTNGIRNDIIAGFKEAGVGAIEWPGGCAANGYNWEKNTNPSDTMGTDGCMDFALAVRAEPVLVGRPKPEFAASN